VFDRVAASVRRLIPFDDMGVVRIVDGERVVLHATTIPCPDSAVGCFDPMPLTAWSPRWRPRSGPTRKIDHASSELDRSFPMDVKVLEAGMGSGLWEPFRRGSSFVGGVWLCAYGDHAFTDEHQEALRPIAALLGSAVEHWRIWDTERRRQERLDGVETLLGTLAQSLDVREVFQRLSDELAPILQHDLMVLTELDLEAKTIRITAFAGQAEVPVPTYAVPLRSAASSTRSSTTSRPRSWGTRSASASSAPPDCVPGCGCRCGCRARSAAASASSTASPRATTARTPRSRAGSPTASR
jgi:hypothetical protein